MRPNVQRNLQLKPTSNSPARASSAPPVYRPGTGSPAQRVKAPIVYRPNPATPVQRMAAPPVYKPVVPAAIQRAPAPPVYKPSPATNPTMRHPVLQPRLEQRKPIPTYNPLPARPAKLTLPNHPNFHSLVQMVRKKKGTETTAVTLTVNGQDFTAKSAAGGGHAEMKALDDYLATLGILSLPSPGQYAAEFSTAVDQLDGATLACHGKWICGRCSTVLEDLGIEPDAQSSFSEYSMNMTNWECTNRVKAFLRYRNLDHNAIRDKKLAGAKGHPFVDPSKKLKLKGISKPVAKKKTIKPRK